MTNYTGNTRLRSLFIQFQHHQCHSIMLKGNLLTAVNVYYYRNQFAIDWKKRWPSHSTFTQAGFKIVNLFRIKICNVSKFYNWQRCINRRRFPLHVLSKSCFESKDLSMYLFSVRGGVARISYIRRGPNLQVKRLQDQLNH